MLNTSPRVCKPWVAAALSTACAGLGQVYCGHVGRGLCMFAMTVAFGPVAALLVLLRPSLITLLLILGCVATAAVVSIVSIVDAARLAQRNPSHGRRGTPMVSWIMIVLSLPGTLGMAVWLRAEVVEAFYLPSSSMAPTLVKGDRVLADKTNAATRRYERGNIIVFRNPANREQRFIKRVVGVPGDSVELRDGTVLVNGEALRREPVNGADGGSDEPVPHYEWMGERRYQVLVGATDENGTMAALTIPESSYFVLGDHRGLSFDSRKFGLVPQADVVGIAAWLYGPAGDWERFGAIE